MKGLVDMARAVLDRQGLDYKILGQKRHYRVEIRHGGKSARITCSVSYGCPRAPMNFYFQIRKAIRDLGAPWLECKELARKDY